MPAAGSAAGWRRRLKSKAVSSSRCVRNKAGNSKYILTSVWLIYFGVGRHEKIWSRFSGFE